MTTLEYLSIRLGNKITQVISTDNIHIINGKVVVDMGKEKNECQDTTIKGDILERKIL